MPVNYKEDRIRVENVVGEESFQKTIEGELKISEERPEIGTFLQLRGDIRSIEASIVDEGVEVRGRAELYLLYAGFREEEEGSLLTFEHEEMDFNDYVPFSEACSGMEVMLEADISDVTSALKGDRSVSYLVTISMVIRVVEKSQLGFIDRIEGLEREAELQTQRVSIEELVEERAETIRIQEEVDLTEEGMQELLYHEARLIRLDEELIKDELELRGVIGLNLIYLSPDGPRNMTRMLEFRELLQIDNHTEEVSISNLIEIRETEVSSRGPGRIMISLLLEGYIRLIEVREVELITDLESKKVDTQREIKSFDLLLDDKREENWVEHTLNLPQEYLDLSQILHFRAVLKKCMTEASDGGALITGQIEASILYLGEAREQFMSDMIIESFVFESLIPLSQTEDEMVLDTRIQIRNLDYEVLNARTLKLKVQLDQSIRALKHMELEVVSDLVVTSPLMEEEDLPSIVLYVVQPGDNLWKIARRFGAREEDILRANKDLLAQPEDLRTGDKLTIRRDAIGKREEE